MVNSLAFGFPVPLRASNLALTYAGLVLTGVLSFSIVETYAISRSIQCPCLGEFPRHERPVGRPASSGAFPKPAWSRHLVLAK